MARSCVNGEVALAVLYIKKGSEKPEVCEQGGGAGCFAQRESQEMYEQGGGAGCIYIYREKGSQRPGDV